MTRLERETFTNYSKYRAEEELVAELGAAMLCGVTGVSPEPRDDHAVYLKGWLQRLKDDPKAIFKAAAKASQASSFILNAYEVQQNHDEQIAA